MWRWKVLDSVWCITVDLGNEKAESIDGVWCVTLDLGNEKVESMGQCVMYHSKFRKCEDGKYGTVCDVSL